MRARFLEHYQGAARFREDRALAEALCEEAEPVIDVLSTTYAPPEGPRSVHEGYALLNALARRAASLGATPSVALTLPSAIAEALRVGGVVVDPSLEAELAIVSLEGYCAARDERLTQELRAAAASHQIAVELGPRCLGIFLVGRHEEPDLGPTLDQLARELLRRDAQSCLLDVSRLELVDEELARSVGRFCIHGATLGVCTFVYGASALLREQFERWSLTSVATSFVDDYDLAQTQALAAAGLVVRRRRRWARLFFPARSAMVR